MQASVDQVGVSHSKKVDSAHIFMTHEWIQAIGGNPRNPLNTI
jgi:hypothetical protein